MYSPPHQFGHQPGLSRGPGDGDVNVTINLPTAGMQIMEADGLLVNVTVANAGGTYVNQSFNVTLHVQNKNNVFHKFLDIYEVTDLGATGNSTTFSFKNWTDLFISGDYTINVTTHLLNDTETNNDTTLLDIHVEPSIQPLEMAMDSARVQPHKGLITTPFNFSVKYTFNYFPEEINVTIDDEVFDLEQADIFDLNASDGKDYYFLTKLTDIGLHGFRFQAAYGNNSTASNVINSPWVNLTLQDPRVTPDSGNITDLYNFTVTYGDFNNNQEHDITLNINSETFEFHPNNPANTDFSAANNNYYCKVYGYQMGLGPLKWTIIAEAGEDSLTIGPFNFTGPSADTGTIRGNVKKSDGFPLKDVVVTLNPLKTFTAWTDGDGNYMLEEVPTGHNYQLIFSKQGFINSTAGSITVPKDTTVHRNTTMSPLPVGGDIAGWVVDEIRKIPLPDAKVTATTAQGSITTTTDQVGRYEFKAIQAQPGVNLSVEKAFYVPEYTLIDVKEVQVALYNFTLIEEDPPFIITPENDTLNISVGTGFIIEFRTAVNISTFNATLYSKEGGKWVPVNNTPSYDNETYIYTLDPVNDLRYNTDHKMTLNMGLERTDGSLYLWRDFSLVFRTTFKPLKNITVHPWHTQDDIPLNVILSITLDVEVDPASVNVILAKKDSLSLSGLKNITHFNPVGSAQVHTLILFTPGRDLTNNTIYSVRLLKTLTDSLGNILLSEDYDWYFRTIKDIEDPIDIDTDPDKDGIPTDWEEYWGLNPYVPDSSEDPDNDALTNLREYQLSLNPLSNDTDGDGMTDGWEHNNGLDPRNPSDAGQDLDGDGHTNKEEFDMGTDPTDAQDPAPEKDNETDTVWYITFGVAAILVIVILIVVVIVLRSRKELKEEEAEADEEDMMNGSLKKKRTKAERTRSREEEEVLEESESLGIDLEEAEKAFMEDHLADEEDEE